jgi:hypothetical protein
VVTKGIGQRLAIMEFLKSMVLSLQGKVWSLRFENLLDVIDSFPRKKHTCTTFCMTFKFKKIPAYQCMSHSRKFSKAVLSSLSGHYGNLMSSLHCYCYYTNLVLLPSCSGQNPGVIKSSAMYIIVKQQIKIITFPTQL